MSHVARSLTTFRAGMTIEKRGGFYVLYNHAGTKRLSKPGSLVAIKKRERQVQYFKHHPTTKK